MLKHSYITSANILRDEEAAFERSIPTGDPQNTPTEELAQIAAHVADLRDRVLEWKDAAELWVKGSSAKAYATGKYQDRGLYVAYQERYAWAKRMHQRLLVEAGVWSREVARRKHGNVSAAGRPDIGAEVIYAAYRYRASRTTANGVALDNALAALAEASIRWADVQRSLK